MSICRRCSARQLPCLTSGNQMKEEKLARPKMLRENNTLWNTYKEMGDRRDHPEVQRETSCPRASGRGWCLQLISTRSSKSLSLPWSVVQSWLRFDPALQRPSSVRFTISPAIPPGLSQVLLSLRCKVSAQWCWSLHGHVWVCVLKRCKATRSRSGETRIGAIRTGWHSEVHSRK